MTENPTAATAQSFLAHFLHQVRARSLELDIIVMRPHQLFDSTEPRDSISILSQQQPCIVYTI